MLAGGFQYWPSPPLPAKFRVPALPLTVADAQAHGYAAFNPPPAPGDAESSAYQASLSESQRASYSALLSGTDNAKIVVKTSVGEITVGMGGCRGKALSQLFPDPADRKRYVGLDFEVSNLNQVPAFDQATDPNLVAATKKWSSCMAAAGRQYASPDDAIEAAGALSPDANNPSPPAIAIAVADATCRQQTAYDAANSAAARNAFAVAAESVQADLLAYNQLAVAATARAKVLIG
ncbi:MAG: hypothetical protein DLM58_04660 [Pseudonocardiales bacterium]|nr:MAG: hypothetical protein DLM58_04660 [Pseudonocardiales bacterium]